MERDAAIAYACDVTDRELVYSIVKDAEEEVCFRGEC